MEKYTKAKESISISVVLYRAKTLADGSHPIMIRLYKQGVVKYKSIGYSCKPNQWDQKKSRANELHQDYIKLNFKISDSIRDLDAEINELNNKKLKVSPDRIIKVLTPETSPNITVEDFWNQHIDNLKSAGQYGTADTHKESCIRFSKFRKNKKTSFESIDCSMLNKYEFLLRKDGLKDTSISTRFRDLRRIYRLAIASKLVSLAEYPFGRKDDLDKFCLGKFKTGTKKRAISEKDFKELKRLFIDPIAEPKLFNAKNYWMFSYYTAGTPFVDMIHLKWINIYDNILSYARKKNGKQVDVPITAPAQKILDHYYINSGGNQSNYIFPVLDHNLHVSSIQIKNRREKVLNEYNQALHELEKRLNVPYGYLTSYTARHTSFSTLKRKGATMEEIQNLANHESSKTTKIYIDSLPINDTDLLNRLITD
jgi:integrase